MPKQKIILTAVCGIILSVIVLWAAAYANSSIARTGFAIVAKAPLLKEKPTIRRALPVAVLHESGRITFKAMDGVRAGAPIDYRVRKRGPRLVKTRMSPSGSAAAVAGKGRGESLFIAGLAMGKAFEVLRLKPESSIGSFVWSPKGGKILLALREAMNVPPILGMLDGGGGSGFKLTLVELDVARGRTRVWPGPRDHELSELLLWRGQSVYFRDGANLHLLRLPAAGTSKARAKSIPFPSGSTAGYYQSFFSPDLNRVVQVAGVSDEMRILNRQTGRAVHISLPPGWTLETGNGYEEPFVWSKGGKQAAFLLSRRVRSSSQPADPGADPFGERWAIFSFDLEKGKAKRLLDLGEHPQYAIEFQVMGWHPDGRWLLYGQRRHGPAARSTFQVHVLDLTDGHRRVLARSTGEISFAGWLPIK